jgi:hypothetical protein
MAAISLDARHDSIDYRKRHLTKNCGFINSSCNIENLMKLFMDGACSTDGKEMRNAKKNAGRKTSLGRPRRRWEDTLQRILGN